MSLDEAITGGDLKTFAARYAEVRRFSEQLSEPLSAEDCAIQSMPDVSPTRWHLAHTTWFFETFVLSQFPNHELFNADYAYLFNSYYNTIGKQYPRSQRGLLSRPGLDEVRTWRHHVDTLVLDALRTGEGVTEDTLQLLEVGMHHEQQHQELMLTDIKHVLSRNPLRPIYRDGQFGVSRRSESSGHLKIDEGIYWIGHDGGSFAFDNEAPRHRVFLNEFDVSRDLTTCGGYLQFIDDGGYQRPEFWLSAGWQTVCDQEWQAPLYWFRKDDQWYQFTLAGPREVEPRLPVTHVSYFEAEAFARWSQSRLPTEAEWEVASQYGTVDGNFVDKLLAEDSAIHPHGGAGSDASIVNMFGDVWEWTASPYVPYPGYASPAGAIGEYNGKFMCNQFVLRGGSCATSSDHIRGSYRNFFPPDARWQFAGIRLCQQVRCP
jgi:ergothioneine biosynthesis protein EgtB